MKSNPITMKTYKQAPLPFQGQKRKFLKAFKEALKGCSPTATYVDLFGGSGLLSHTIKRYYPEARVIYNDFDNYSSRIALIDRTNRILKDIRAMVQGLPKDKAISPAAKEKILDRISSEKGDVDFITLSSSLLFSMKYATSLQELAKQTFYNCIKETDYNADGYLNGLEIVRMDYQTLYCEHSVDENVIYLVDPPYLSTDVSTYSKNYWRLGNYLDVLDVLERGKYFYFTSNKSQVVELCNWVSTKTGTYNPFDGATYVGVNVNLNYSAQYTDMMFYKQGNSGSLAIKH